MASSDHIISPNSYYDRYNPKLLELIPPDARCVLEIGCGTGRLAEAYRKINPAVDWYGFESNTDAVIAYGERKDVQFIWTGDVEEYIGLPDDAEAEIEADVLIFGDVLEHLRDPWKALAYFTKWINPGGLILASIPNVGHWTMIRSLMAGHWTYADEGLLDRTHLRFFTLEGIKAMFADAGLHVFEVRGRQIFNDGFDAWCRKWKIEDPPKEWLAYQYIVRALKPEPPPILFKPPSDEAITALKADIKRMHSSQSGPGQIIIAEEPFMIEYKVPPLHIHAVVHRCPENGTCCERPRIDEPLAALATIPGVRTSKSDESQPTAIPDILIQQRFHSFDLVIQSAIVAAGPIVIAEWDDNPEAFPAQQANDFLALRAVHAVQCSTEKLAKVIRKYNPNVAVFENQLAELPEWTDRVLPSFIPMATGIFFGALNREEDWKLIMLALRRIAMDNQGRLAFIVVHDRAFYESIKDAGCAAQFKEFLPYPEYIATLRSCDIALLPLEPTEFNECKSDIKFLECAANGVCVLASEIVYAAPIRQQFGSKLIFRTSGLVYHETAPFEMQLAKLIESPELRRDLAKNAYEQVKQKRMLGQHYKKRFIWYQSLLANRERLHRELLERVPALKGAK